MILMWPTTVSKKNMYEDIFPRYDDIRCYLRICAFQQIRAKNIIDTMFVCSYDLLRIADKSIMFRVNSDWSVDSQSR